jgi:hypothetical protein
VLDQLAQLRHRLHVGTVGLTARKVGFLVGMAAS